MKRTILISLLLTTLFRLTGQEETSKIKFNPNHSISVSLNGNDADYGSRIQGLGLRYAMDFEFLNFARIGGGAGIEVFNINREAFFLPVFLKTEIFIPGIKVVRPLIGCEIGYGFLTNDKNFWGETQGGISFNPNIGLGWKIHPEVEFQTKFGYQLQRSKEIYESYIVGGENSRQVDHKRLNVSFGIRF